MRHSGSQRQRLIAIVVAVVVCLASSVSAFAFLNNGGFEDGNFSSWEQQAKKNNAGGLLGLPPFSGSSIVLNSGGTDTSQVLGGPGVQPLSMSDPKISAIKFPRFGNYVARLGDTTAGTNTNIISQTAPISTTDIDSFDNKVHARFAFLPVLQNPNHSDNEQPFFYIALRDITKNQLVYENFTFAGQKGVPWQTGPNSTLYTDWQVVDVVVGDSSVVGDQLQLVAIVAGCSQGGHFGYAYLDAFGSSLPGLFVNKTAAGTVLPGQPLTYSIVARNSGNTSMDNVVVTENLPSQTTFVGVSDNRCTINGTQTVLTCNFGTLAASSTIPFTMTVNVNANASGTITNGNYTISGTNYPALLGQPVVTKIQNPTSISLSRFAATRQGDKVLIDWSTSAEVQTFGYALYRSASGRRGDAERITPDLIPSRGPSGGSYQWADTTALPDVSYSYWLEEQTTGGSRNQYGPASVAARLLLSHRLLIPIVSR